MTLTNPIQSKQNKTKLNENLQRVIIYDRKLYSRMNAKVQAFINAQRRYKVK